MAKAKNMTTDPFQKRVLRLINKHRSSIATGSFGYGAANMKKLVRTQTESIFVFIFQKNAFRYGTKSWLERPNVLRVDVERFQIKNNKIPELVSIAF